MTTYFARGSADTALTIEDLRRALAATFDQLGDVRRAICIPPDFTRVKSQAGKITQLIYQHLGDRLVDILPAIGTHDPLSPEQLERMFGEVPSSLFRVHRWRTDVETIGHVGSDFVRTVTEGIWDRPWPAQLNRLVLEGGHDLILSVGQVVPHEVIGMANHNKNLFVGVGGSAGINESHFIGAVYGMERMMGRTVTPLRRILDEAERTFCSHLPIMYVLTVVADTGDGLAIRGLYIGDDRDCFEQAAQLAREVNMTLLDERPAKVVVHLDEDEFHSTWLGNKAIYRTRMAIADEGELIILAPGVRTFGEDVQIDKLIREFGYRTTPEVLAAVDASPDLQQNLSAAAHLIHGSSEGRFRITYCPGQLTETEIRQVGYDYAPLESMLRRYNPAFLRDGWNDLPDGDRIFFIRHPSLGLWAHASCFRDHAPPAVR